MDIEKLNKFQIVLLTLLISFVTSIATGIVTVSLMEQAPPVIPQTINRVVERTIERVVPHETQTATVITTEKTVVVKESDLIAQAVARVRSSVVRIHGVTSDGKTGDFVARGFVIADGYVVAPLTDGSSNTVYAVLIGEKIIPGKVLKIDTVKNIALITLTESEEEHTPAAVMGTGPITLGQTVIAVTGNPNLKVATGIVTTTSATSTDSGESVPLSFETDVSESLLVSGSPLLNTDGAVIGMFVDSPRIASILVLTDLFRSLAPVENKTESKATTTKSTR